MNNDYNKEQHRTLLEYSEKLKKQNKRLSQESTEDFFQLSVYSAMIFSQYTWDEREETLKVFRDFLTNEIPSYVFCEILEEKMRLNKTLLQSNPLKFNIIHQKAENFTNFISEVRMACEVCCSYPEHPGDISEIEFRKETEEIFLKLNELLEE